MILKLQALVYDILPSTAAIFSYVTRSRKLSANRVGGGGGGGGERRIVQTKREKR